MKTLRILTIFFAALLSLSCSAQKILSDVASLKGVTSVYIGKTMLRLGAASAATNYNTDLDISKIINKLNSIEIINCEDRKMIPHVENLATAALAHYQFETLTEVSDDGDCVTISGVPGKDGDCFTLLMIKAVESDEITYILMSGEVDVETLAEAMEPNY